MKLQILCTFALLGVSLAHILRDPVSLIREEDVLARMAKAGPKAPTEKTFDQVVDHLTNGGNVKNTWKQRYLVNEQYFDKTDPTAPILFYAGNEGGVYTFYDNSGFVTETVAKEMKGLVVFGEHRYFGKSMPFGDKSFDQDNIKFLTVEQAMYDYVKLIAQIRKDYNSEKRAVIVFGGSYGGMLASWLRFKFPHVFQGAHAASAPILFFPGTVSPYAFNQVVTEDFKGANKECPSAIQMSLNKLQAMQNDKTKYEMLTKAFNTCHNVTSAADVNALLNLAQGAYGSMAMVDYPYPTSFLAPLPAFPVNHACSSFNFTKKNKNETEMMMEFAGTFNFFYQQDPKKCLDAFSVSFEVDKQGWDYLSCDEMIMP